LSKNLDQKQEQETEGDVFKPTTATPIEKSNGIGGFFGVGGADTEEDKLNEEIDKTKKELEIDWGNPRLI